MPYAGQRVSELKSVYYYIIISIVFEKKINNNFTFIRRSFFQLVGDLDELKKKDYPELNKLKITLGDKKVSKGMFVYIIEYQMFLINNTNNIQMIPMVL